MSAWYSKCNVSHDGQGIVFGLYNMNTLQSAVVGEPVRRNAGVMRRVACLMNKIREKASPKHLHHKLSTELVGSEMDGQWIPMSCDPHDFHLVQTSNKKEKYNELLFLNKRQRSV